MKTGIRYTRGTIQKLTDDYYTLVLYNNDKIVYKATIGREAAANYTHNSKLITVLF